MNMIQCARFIVGLAWIYHGLFPKLLQVAPLELAMAGSLGLSDELTYMLIKSAGVGEIIFGVVFILLYQVRWVQILNLLGLIGLLVFSSVMTPYLLMEAFNPVTTNIPLIFLGYLLLQHAETVRAKHLSKTEPI